MGGRISKAPSRGDEDGYNVALGNVECLLAARQLTVTILLWVLSFVLFYVYMQSLVTGFCIVSTPTGIAVPHLVWFCSSFVVVVFGFTVTRFSVTLAMDTINAGVIYLFVICGLNIVVCLVSGGLFIVEIVQGVSTFAVQSFGFLVATIIITGISLVLTIALIVCTHLFKRDLNDARMYYPGWQPTYKETSDCWSISPHRDTDIEKPDLTKAKINFKIQVPAQRRNLLK
jgi:hypothetical protein